MTINLLPDNADLETCIDSCLKEVCDAITQRRNLPATLAVALAFLPKDQERTLAKKYRARCN